MITPTKTHKIHEGISFEEVSPTSIKVEHDLDYVKFRYIVENFKDEKQATLTELTAEYFVRKDSYDEKKMNNYKAELNKFDNNIYKALENSNDDMFKLFLEEEANLIDYVRFYVENNYPVNHYLKGYKPNLTFHLIEVGTLATESIGSDRQPYVVTAVTKSGKTITVQKIGHTKTDDFDYFSNQTYTYDPTDLQGREVKVRITNRGWKSTYSHFTFGSARYYKDPSF